MTKVIYLSGPMTGLSFNAAEEWRTETQKRFEAIPGIKVLNPARNCHIKEDEIYQAINPYKIFGLDCDIGLKARNQSDIRCADMVFVNLLGAVRPSLGTVHEMGYAEALNKTIVCVVEDHGNVHQHLMITTGLLFRFNNLPEAFSGALTIFGGKPPY